MRRERAASNDMVPLGELLRKHGFNVAENADLGSPPAPGVHDATGYHYRCHDSAAIDVNHDQGNEGAALDALVAPLHKLGYRTIWRARGTSTTCTSTSRTRRRSARASRPAAPSARWRRRRWA